MKTSPSLLLTGNAKSANQAIRQRHIFFILLVLFVAFHASAQSGKSSEPTTPTGPEPPNTQRTASPLTPALSPLRGEGEPQASSGPHRAIAGSLSLATNDPSLSAMRDLVERYSTDS